MDDLSNNKGNPSFTSVHLGNNGVSCKASWSWLEKILNFFLSSSSLFWPQRPRKPVVLSYKTFRFLRFSNMLYLLNYRLKIKGSLKWENMPNWRRYFPLLVSWFWVDSLLNVVLRGLSLVKNTLGMNRELSSGFILMVSLWMTMFSFSYVSKRDRRHLIFFGQARSQ